MESVAIVYGTRPEAIKLAPVIRAIRESDALRCVVVVTGQHRSMLEQVHDAFGISPDIDLDLFADGQALPQLTSRVLITLDPVLSELKPRAVLVQGDTSSAFAAALAAFYSRTPVVHLEAGLRTADSFNPFPEEMNRRLVTRLASLHLAPTPRARRNLAGEGIPGSEIVVTGNTVIDALLGVANMAYCPPPHLREAHEFGGRIVLVTAHRRESWGQPMDDIASAVRALANDHPDVLFVMPLHLNPIVRKSFMPALAPQPNARILDPVSYVDFVHLMKVSHLVLTDSGGIQEEAPALGRPVLVLRNNTERPEAVEAGTARLVGTTPREIQAGVNLLLEDAAAHRRMATAANPFGDGKAATRCVAAMSHLLGMGAPADEFTPGPAIHQTEAQPTSSQFTGHSRSE